MDYKNHTFKEACVYKINNWNYKLGIEQNMHLKRECIYRRCIYGELTDIFMTN